MLDYVLGHQTTSQIDQAPLLATDQEAVWASQPSLMSTAISQLLGDHEEAGTLGSSPTALLRYLPNGPDLEPPSFLAVSRLGSFPGQAMNAFPPTAPPNMTAAPPPAASSGLLADPSLAAPRLDISPVAASPEPAPTLVLVKSVLHKVLDADQHASKRSRRVTAAALAGTVYPAATLADVLPPGINKSNKRRQSPGTIPTAVEDPDLESTSAGKKENAVRRETERCIAILTPAHAQRILPFSAEEIAQANWSEAQLAERVRPAIYQQVQKHRSSAANARLALLSLYDYSAGQGIKLVEFKASVGLVSTWLTAQVGTMARKRLTGIKWAVSNWAVDIDARNEGLSVFAEERGSGAGHAITTALLVCCCWANHAVDSANNEYSRAVAGGATLGIAGSCRYGDLQGSKIKALASCIEGHGPSKTSKLAYWWADKHDFLGSSEYIKPVLRSLKDCAVEPDFVFRRARFKEGHAGDPEHFEGWGEGPAVKAHVVETLITILMHDLEMSREEAKRWVRLHGCRRVYPLAARHLSSLLKLTVEDREELGRWAGGRVAATGDASRDKAARREYLSNRYGSDAERPRAVAVRKRVGDAVRDAIRAFNNWRELPADNGGYEILIDGGVDFAECEPDLSSDESDMEVE